MKTIHATITAIGTPYISTSGAERIAVTASDGHTYHPTTARLSALGVVAYGDLVGHKVQLEIYEKDEVLPNGSKATSDGLVRGWAVPELEAELAAELNKEVRSAFAAQKAASLVDKLQDDKARAANNRRLRVEQALKAAMPKPQQSATEPAAPAKVGG